MIEVGQIITIDARRDFTVERIEGEGSKQVAVGTLQRVTDKGKPASPQTMRYSLTDLERVVEKALYTEGEFNFPDGAKLVIKKVTFPHYVVEATAGIETKKEEWTHAQVSQWMKAHIEPAESPADVHIEATSEDTAVDVPETTSDDSLLDKVAELTHALDIARAECEAAIAQRDDKAEALVQANEIINWQRGLLRQPASAGIILNEYKFAWELTIGKSLTDLEADGWMIYQLFSGLALSGEPCFNAVLRRPAGTPAPKGNGLDKATIISAQSVTVMDGQRMVNPLQTEINSGNERILNTMRDAAITRAHELGVEVYHAAQ